MTDRAEGLLVLLAMVFLAFLFIWIGGNSSPVGWFIFGNTGLMLLAAIVLGLGAAILILMFKE
ncbi:hypothetical protein E3E26_06915 [Thermococcus sp. LS1]|uniref:hypothetical protein n=1 Tax=Thermococcus sp. LS1 TaxID=1638259 RepID=UPI00143A74FB|nr:hypothetical protein [Thermococcus sp. LS1]NJD99514.1 hypothetical protein [Thermococcus sp. LS1]